ncbi:MAG TPA: SDR family oxidoreductase [Thermodesulfobacteriota bacterium]|nr:SDR family oxidoreductase [Thermodesulfobacteriota bacterium]
MSMKPLQGKVGVVTGGGQGIGKGIAKRLLEEGMSAVIAEMDKEAGQEAEAELKHLGPVLFIRTDVRDEASVKNCVALVTRELGRLDALVNNAGIAHAEQGPIEKLKLDDWNRMISTHLTGCFLCAKHASPHLRKYGGSIVNIASTRAFQSEANTEAYSAAKGGMVALTHALAISLGPEVRVNCIAPGWIDVRAWKKGSRGPFPGLRPIDHAQHPVGRVGKPEDVAALAAFLLSDQAGFIAGQVFIADGGMTRKMIYVE